MQNAHRVVLLYLKWSNKVFYTCHFFSYPEVNDFEEVSQL